MTNNKISLYTEKEQEELKKLIDQFDKKEIDADHFHIETNKYILLCEGRKNRIRFNNLTKMILKMALHHITFLILWIVSFIVSRSVKSSGKSIKEIINNSSRVIGFYIKKFKFNKNGK